MPSMPLGVQFMGEDAVDMGGVRESPRWVEG